MEKAMSAAAGQVGRMHDPLLALCHSQMINQDMHDSNRSALHAAPRPCSHVGKLQGRHSQSLQSPVLPSPSSWLIVDLRVMHV